MGRREGGERLDGLGERRKDREAKRSRNGRLKEGEREREREKYGFACQDRRKEFEMESVYKHSFGMTSASSSFNFKSR